MNIEMGTKYKKQLFSGIGIFRFLMIGLFVLSGLPGFAQFTITEDFRGSASANIVIGDDAQLTSGVFDPVNAGWLRLTPNEGNKKGFTYINKSFPSTLGVLVDFEYKMWKNTTGGSGADGIGIFLFDGIYGPTLPNLFKLGGYGGSLGYARDGTSAPITPGITGGYVGIALDAYGNFSNAGDRAKLTGPGERGNSVALRGPTTTNTTATASGGVESTNRFLTGVTIKGADAGTLYPISGASDEIGNKTQNHIDYNTQTTTRPTDVTFYRRVQIEILPTPGNKYRIIVRWMRSPTDTFRVLIDHETTDVPPQILKIGFAASTGGDKNFHEIRNLLVTTPGNLRVTKRANKDILRTVPAVDNANKVEYTIDVNNDTNGPLNGVDFTDKLTDGAGNLITPAMFTIDPVNGITHTGFLAGTVLPTTSSVNEFSGTLNMAANSIGRITVKGTLNQIPVGNALINTTTALPTDIVDQDLGNNTSVVTTPVIAENVDLVVDKTVAEPCIDLDNGNNFALKVINLGALPARYGGENVTRNGTGNGGYPRSGTYTRTRIEVTEVVPPGFTMSNLSNTGWSYATQANTPTAGYTTYVFKTNYVAVPNNQDGNASTNYTDLSSGLQLPSITFRLTRTSGTATSYTSTAAVRYITESGSVSNKTAAGIAWTYSSPTISNLELVANQSNNADAVDVVSLPPKLTITSPIYYCLGETAAPLTATPASGNTLKWYLSLGGAPSTVAFTPSTATVGTTTYYVSQTNGNCESELAQIDVIVLQTPTPGSISTNAPLVCKGAGLTQLINSIGTGAPGSVITYRWEKSEDAGSSWSVVPGQTDRNYFPVNMQRTTSYRRITIATLGGKSCESVPTSEMLITVRNCTVISNPMMPSKARSN